MDEERERLFNHLLSRYVAEGLHNTEMMRQTLQGFSHAFADIASHKDPKKTKDECEQAAKALGRRLADYAAEWEIDEFIVHAAIMKLGAAVMRQMLKKAKEETQKAKED